ncbi:MAG: T9SS type A sorting domain-containing protein [Fidelibacterota bacterium]|nr:MAG: T9SS type A sorting domain-containing protein [Candidatus Neomarinimicrobiota bacterium]
MKKILLPLSLILLVLAGTLAAQGRGRGGPHSGPQLTDEQKATVQELVSGMREDGASREEIHVAVAELFESWGLEPPVKGRWGAQHRRPAFMDQLTDEQKAAVHELIDSMREAGATREEIHTAVVELLGSWGIEVPAGPGPGHGRHGRPGFMHQLTDEQQAAIRELRRTMRAEGATREEIHAAVIALLNEWGIDLPEDGPWSDQTQRRIQARNYPNPFNPDTRISYTLSEPNMVRVSIYNIAGQLVRSFDQGYQPAGTYSVLWDGTTADGIPASSGIYLYRIQSGHDVFTQRMLLMK